MAGKGTIANLNRTGRKPGAKNLTSKAAAEAVLEALRRRGGVKWLEKIADPLFSQLIAKLLPNKIDVEGELRIGWEGMVARLAEGVKDG